MSLAALHRFFVAAFESNEALLIFLENVDPALRVALPSAAGSRDVFAFRTLEVLRSRGYLDPLFFQILLQRLPRHAAAIAELAAPHIGQTRAAQLLHAISPPPRPVVGPQEKLRILLLAADPDPRDREARKIQDAFGARNVTDRVELHTASAVDARQFADQLLHHKPHVLHFAGKGDREGEPLLLGSGPDALRPASVDALRRLFRQVPQLKCVVFNASYSARVAQELALEIAVVVGMRGELEREATLGFAEYFYRSIAEGRSLLTAYDIARSIVELQHPASADLVQINFSREIDPGKITLLPP